MRRLPVIVLIAMLVIPLLAPAGAGTFPRDRDATKRLPVGVWGGEHIRMEVSRGGAEIEFDCARGQIPKPLVLDRNHSFQQKGIYKAETPAPAKAGGPRWNATYSGRLTGTSLHLEVSISGVQGVRAFDLDYGQEGSLSKCASSPGMLSTASAALP